MGSVHDDTLWYGQMSAERERLKMAIRAGCNASDAHLTCSYPDCKCKQMPTAIKAALAFASQDHGEK